MELSQYIRLLRKWLWLFILAAFVGGGLSFVLTSRQTPTYGAEALVSVGQYMESPNPNAADIRTGFDLVATYAELARTYPVLQAVVDELNLNVQPEQIESALRTGIVQNTTLLELTITWDDPVVAVDIVNEVGEQLIIQSPTNLTPEQIRNVEFNNQQIAALNEQIAQSQIQADQLNTQLQLATDSAEIIRLTDQRNTLINQINDATANIASFSSNNASIQQRANALEIVERARTSYPVSSGRGSLLTTLIGVGIGLALALGAVLLIEYLDDTVRSTEIAVTTLGLPVFGAIMRFGKRNHSYQDRLLTKLPPMSPITEAYRNLRTNLLYNTKDNSTKKPIYIVTSPGPEEGKSLTSANLAITLALAGLRVLLIDADLRRPKIHEIFGLENQVGLTTLLFAEPGNKENPNNDDPEKNAFSMKMRQCLQDTFVPELRVITSGFTPSNPSELLGSTLMKRWIDIFRKAQNVDAIVIDTPPCLVVADSTVLAATIDANVVLVINSEKTRRPAAVRAKAQFDQLGVKINGLILNQVNPREENYGYGYSSYYYYGPVNGTPNGNGKGLRRLLNPNNRSKQQT